MRRISRVAALLVMILTLFWSSVALAFPVENAYRGFSVATLLKVAKSAIVKAEVARVTEHLKVRPPLNHSDDPIGLEGGVNPYGYAENPLKWIDSLGLAVSQNGHLIITNTFRKKNKSWKDIIKSTKTGPVKYTHDVDIKNLEYDVFNTGNPVTNDKPWKVKDMGKVIGASEGKESQWMRGELSGSTIHDHPISLDEYRRLTTP